jgi:ribonuclease G
VLEKCPVCNGSGSVKSNILIIDEIEQKLEYLADHSINRPVLEVNPFIYAYITKGWFKSIARKWAKKYHIKFNVKSNDSFHYLQYVFFNNEGEEVHF